MIVIVARLHTITEAFSKEKAFEHLKGALAFKTRSSSRIFFLCFLLFVCGFFKGFVGMGFFPP